MGVTYSGLSSGSALFARWKQSFRTEVHHFVEILTSSPLRKKIDYSVLVAIHQKWKGLRLIAQDSCMIHWLYAASLSSKATIIGTCSKLSAWNSVCLEQVYLRKKIELKVKKVASLDQVIFKYSGLKARFGCIYVCSVMINWTVSSENCDKGNL